MARKGTISIRKGDQVKVIAGKDKGVTGSVIEVIADQNRVIVEGVNRVKRHTKPSQAGGAGSGGIITSEAPIHISNVMLLADKTADSRRLPPRRRHQEPSRRFHLHRAAQRAHREEDRKGDLSMAHHHGAPRLKARYREEILPALREQFDYANVMQVPGLTKIVVNMGVGEAARDGKLIEGALRDLTAITGQKPQVTKARKSIAQFKLREGMPIGAHVTLRGDRMWEFLDRLLTLALPRIRDFRGLSPKQFDGRGNYTFGLTEQVMFHEIDQDKIDRSRGMDITIVTTATNDDEGRALLKLLGFPYKEN